MWQSYRALSALALLLEANLVLFISTFPSSEVASLPIPNGNSSLVLRVFAAASEAIVALLIAPMDALPLASWEDPD